MELHENPSRNRNGQLPDYYDILGVPENAPFREIRDAYWRRAFSADGRPHLPLLNEAYEVLGNKDARNAYDAQRGSGMVQFKKSSPAPQHDGDAESRPRIW